MIKLYNGDNLEVMNDLYKGGIKVDLIYADCIYESHNLDWIYEAIRLLKDNGIFIVQTDHHTLLDYLDKIPFAYWGDQKSEMTFINHLVWKNEWGNHPKDRFHQCFDDILIYCKGNEWKFRSDRIQVPKATANTRLNPSGRETKTATAWIDDICLTTTAKERIKGTDGHLVKWQKPEKLMERILAPFSDEGNLILDPFMGTGTTGAWCIKNNRSFIGIELDKEIYSIAEERLIFTDIFNIYGE